MPNWKTDKRRSPANEMKCAISGCHHPPVMGFYDYRLCQIHADYYFDDQARTDRLKKILKIVEPAESKPEAYRIPDTKLIEAEVIQPLEEDLDDIFPKEQEEEIDTEDFFPKETVVENLFEVEVHCPACGKARYKVNEFYRKQQNIRCQECGKMGMNMQAKETSDANGPDVDLPDAVGDDGTPAESSEGG